MQVFGIILVAASIAGHLYFAMKYRSFFIVGKDQMHRSGWQMIKALKQNHPIAGNIYVGVYCVSILGIVLLAADEFTTW